MSTDIMTEFDREPSDRIREHQRKMAACAEPISDMELIEKIIATPLPPPQSVTSYGGGFVLEVRTGEDFDPQWWVTAIENARKVGRRAALAYKVGDGRWSVRVHGRDISVWLEGSDYTVDMDKEAFQLAVAVLEGYLPVCYGTCR